MDDHQNVTALRSPARRRVLGLLLALSIAGALYGFWARVGLTPDPLPIRIGIPLQPGSALMLLARDQGFFEKEGLAPHYTLYPSGKRALDEGLFAQRADVVSTADLPAVYRLNRGDDLVILTAFQLVRSIIAVLVRRDRGISALSDLCGRRVGVQPISAVHFFLDCALRAHGLSPCRVIQVPYKIEELGKALVAGEIDAISIRETFLSETRDLLGENGMVFEAPWAYPQFGLLVARGDFSRNHSEELTRVIRALVRAERFLAEKPDEAMAGLAQALSVTPNQVRPIFENTLNQVGLPQSMIPILENQMQWIGGRSPPAQQQPVQVIRSLFVEPLRSAHPERIALAGGHSGKPN